jgi:predicted metal-binding protein
MTTHVAIICASCPAGQPGLGAALQAAFTAQSLAFEWRETECMSGCTRPSTLAFRAAGKMAYLFGEITTADLPDLLTFARLYLASPDGTLADARPIGALRLKAIARIPG